VTPATDGIGPVPRFQILALDGGGSKALFTAEVLARLEADLGVSIVDSFDLIAGTSAGGIIALALGAGMPPAEIAQHFRTLSTRVFPKRRRSLLRIPYRLARATYDPAHLTRSLEEILGAKTLGQSTKRLVVTSWDPLVGSVHVFKTPHHARLRRDWRIRMVDAALATSAAPTFLPAAHVDGHQLIDGGVWANNPSVVGIAEAVSMLGIPLASQRVLNIGTTTELRAHKKSLNNGGLLAWGPKATSLILDATSRGHQGIAEHLVGPNNYHRFDIHVPGGLYALDAADPGAMSALAASASRRLSPLFTAQFAGHTAAPYTPAFPITGIS
jgi:patatin-like phospholipase/acyl hydrolase